MGTYQWGALDRERDEVRARRNVARHTIQQNRFRVEWSRVRQRVAETALQELSAMPLPEDEEERERYWLIIQQTANDSTRVALFVTRCYQAMDDASTEIRGLNIRDDALTAELRRIGEDLMDQIN